MPPVQSSTPAQDVTSPPTKSKLKLPVLISIIIFLIVIGIASAAYLFLNNSNKQKACTLEAKICPDGSTVGRTGPNCEFAPCPSSQAPQGKPTDPTASWKTYTNTDHGFSFKYPQGFNPIVTNDIPAQFSLRFEKGTDSFAFDAKPTDYGSFESRLTPTKTTVINEISWILYPESEYCDAGECGKTSKSYQTKYNDMYYTIYLTTIDEDVAEQILSTFKFTK